MESSGNLYVGFQKESFPISALLGEKVSPNRHVVSSESLSVENSIDFIEESSQLTITLVLRLKKLVTTNGQAGKIGFSA